MKQKHVALLKALLEAPSPTGCEMAAANIVRSHLAPIADEIATDSMGSVQVRLNGSDREAVPAVMLAAHMDEIGLMVTYISDDGFLSVSAVGGVDAAILPGMRMDVHTQSKTLRGVVGRKPIHLIDADERKTVTPLDKMVIDLGLPADEVKKLVRIGDEITFGVGFEEFGADMAVSRAFDDKCGVWVAMRVMEKLAKGKRGSKGAAGGAGAAKSSRVQGRANKGDFIIAATTQEEIGTRGAMTSAYSVCPDVAIAFDVTHATDYPGIEKTKYGNIVCGGGPVIARGPNINPVVFDLLVAAAEREGIPYQIEAEPGVTGTDARAIQVTRGGIPCGLISVPLRYMHTPTEVVCLSDLNNAVRLIARFVSDLDENACFVPGIVSTSSDFQEKDVINMTETSKQQVQEKHDKAYEQATKDGMVAAGERGLDASAGAEKEALAMDDVTTVYEPAAEALEKTEIDGIGKEV